jgi:hypothetical protein
MSSDDPSEPPAATPRPWSPQSWRNDPDRELDWARERDRDRDRDRERARAARERDDQRRREQERPERASDRPRDDTRARPAASGGRTRLARLLRTEPTRPEPVRGRRVRRTVRHLDPWSVLKMALLFNTAVFLIICVGSALLWGGARASGTLDDVEHFITTLGVGSCTADPDAIVDEPSPIEVSTSTVVADESGEDGCPAGQHIEGGFHFEDLRVLELFAFGGVVLVLASTGAMVVVALLFNLMSDLTGGIQVWVVEDEPRRREVGSPASGRRG